MKTFLTVAALSLASFSCWALAELSIQLGHQKQAYGAKQQNEVVTKDYYWGTAFYFSRASTALDFYYSHQTQSDWATDLNIQSESSNYSITSSQTQIKTQSYGVGLKHAFARQRSLIRPTLSIGHARQVVRSAKKFVLRDQTTGQTESYELAPERFRYSSIFVFFALQLKLTKRMSIQTSVQTIFKAFEFKRAKENVKYLFGLTWFL